MMAFGTDSSRDEVYQERSSEPRVEHIQHVLSSLLADLIILALVHLELDLCGGRLSGCQEQRVKNPTEPLVLLDDRRLLIGVNGPTRERGCVGHGRGVRVRGRSLTFFPERTLYLELSLLRFFDFDCSSAAQIVRV